MTVHLDNYHTLHPEGRHLIDGWFRRAWDQRDCAAAKSFEPFIFCWIAFNSWAACVTNVDQDRQIIERLAGDAMLSEVFADAVEQGHAFAGHAKAFQSFWPIFSAKDIRRSGIWRLAGGERRQIVQDYFDQGLRNYEPRDPAQLRLCGAEFPLTWPNTLRVIYRVRCNLFHGEKSVASESDQQIVGAAFRVLVHIFQRFLQEGPAGA